MDNELLRIGAEIGLALIVAGWGWVKRHLDMKQMSQVIDQSETDNKHFKEVAASIGATVAEKALKRWLK